MDKEKKEIVIGIPINYLTKIQQAEKTKKTYANNFYTISLKKQRYEKQLVMMEAEITRLEKLKQTEATKAFKKLKLDKAPNRIWQIIGNNFIGTLKEE